MEARGSERRPDREPANWTARVLAAVFMVLVAGAIILIVQGADVGGDTDSDSGGGERQEASTCADGGEPDAQDAVKNGYFVIEPGDDLSIVADRTCIPIDEITELNPELDPQLIQPGNCVDLRVDGCKALAEQ
jgi:hypothetical protein